MKESFSNQIIDAPGVLERWVQLDKRIRPEEPLIEVRRYESIDPFVSYPYEAPYVRGVVINQALAKLEYRVR